MTEEGGWWREGLSYNVIHVHSPPSKRHQKTLYLPWHLLWKSTTRCLYKARIIGWSIIYPLTKSFNSLINIQIVHVRQLSYTYNWLCPFVRDGNGSRMRALLWPVTRERQNSSGWNTCLRDRDDARSFQRIVRDDARSFQRGQVLGSDNRWQAVTSTENSRYSHYSKYSALIRTDDWGLGIGPWRCSEEWFEVVRVKLATGPPGSHHHYHHSNACSFQQT